MRARGVAPEHADVAALLPWYVNDTLGEDDRGRVEAHLASCERCRHDLEGERRIFEAMSHDDAVEYIPAASLKRLRARLDGPGTLAQAASAAARGRWAERWTRPSWQGLMAASIAIMAVALSFLALDRWNEAHTRPDYHTVTAARARPGNEIIRAVFAPNATLAELQGILDEAQLRIVAGPSEAGVYSLAQTGAHGSVSAALALLRGHAKVRFAESTQLEDSPPTSAQQPTEPDTRR